MDSSTSGIGTLLILLLLPSMWVVGLGSEQEERPYELNVLIRHVGTHSAM